MNIYDSCLSKSRLNQASVLLFLNIDKIDNKCHNIRRPETSSRGQRSPQLGVIEMSDREYERERLGTGFSFFLVIGWIVAALAVVFLVMFFTLVEAVKPGAGEEAVLIHKPMLIGHGGVDNEPIKTGRSYVWWSTYHVTVDMKPRQFNVHLDDFMSSDGVPLDFDAAIRLQVTDSVILVRDFGTDWYKSNVQIEFQNRVRQAVRKHGMNETAISTVAIDAIDAEVTAAMEQYLKDAKLPLKLIQITIGKANPPDSIKSQRVETATQQQRALTERERKLAEDGRKAAEESRALADKAYQTGMNISPDQYIEMIRIKMYEHVCGGDKKPSCTFIIGTSVTPTLPVVR